jgi:hypothetical protein
MDVEYWKHCLFCGQGLPEEQLCDCSNQRDWLSVQGTTEVVLDTRITHADTELGQAIAKRITEHERASVWERYQRLNTNNDAPRPDDWGY